MLSKTAEADRVVESLRERIEEERKNLRARLAGRPRYQRGAKTNERGKLREIFRQFEGLSEQ